MEIKAGTVVYIKATVKPIYKEGNMIRCITSDTGTILWASPQEVKTIDDIVNSTDIICIDRSVNMD